MAGDSDVLAQYNGDGLKITAIVLLALTGCSVGLRTYVRGFMTNSFRADDWLMLVAQANFIVSCTFILLGIDVYGLGHHNEALPQWKEVGGIKWQAFSTASYISNMMFIKLSIGVFLLRLAVQRRYKWFIYGSMTIVFIWSTVLFLWDIFQCKPVAAQWDYTIPNYTCVSPQEIVIAAYALSVLNILTDWLYALLPIPMIWKVKMTWQAKATVVTILGLGIFASVATLIRVKFLAQLADTSDILFAGTNAMIWTVVEPGVAIVASSLVTIRPLLREIRLKGFESSDRSRNRGPWDPHGPGRRSTGRSGNNNNNNNGDGGGVITSKGQWSQLPIDNLELKDLEAGYVDSHLGGERGGYDGKMTYSKGIPSSRGTSLSSRTSTQMNGLGSGGKSWGGALALTLREDHEEEEQEYGQYGQTELRSLGHAVGVAVTKDDDISRGMSPVDASSLNDLPGHKHAASDGSESVLVIEGVRSVILTGASRSRLYALGGSTTTVETTTTWRDEMPQSWEESEGIQGLRYPAPAIRRTADDGE